MLNRSVITATEGFTRHGAPAAITTSVRGDSDMVFDLWCPLLPRWDLRI